MKNIYILILFLILLVLSCCSFKSQTPSQTVLIIIDKISSGNTSNVREKLSTKSKIEPPYLINIILEYSEKNSPEIRREINNDSIASIIVGFNKQNSLLPRFLLFRLIKEENKWKINQLDMTEEYQVSKYRVNSFFIDENKTLFMQTGGSDEYFGGYLFSSYDNGKKWNQINGRFTTITSSPTGILYVGIVFDKYGKNNNGIASSVDGAKTWQIILDNSNYSIFRADLDEFREIVVDQVGTIYAKSSYYLFRSTDLGKTWKEISPNGYRLADLAISSKGELFLNAYFMRTITNPPGDVVLSYNKITNVALFYSKDGGNNWQDIKNIENKSRTKNLIEMTMFYFPSGQLFIIAPDDNYQMKKIEVSIDNGTTWNEATKGISEKDISNISLFSNKDGHIFAISSFNALYLYDNAIIGWKEIRSGNNIYIPFPCKFISESKDILWAYNSYGIYKSTDQGENWTIFYSASERSLIDRMQ